MKKLAGVYEATKKNGQVYYRASITFRGRHISLGSFDSQALGNCAYQEATAILQDEGLTLESIENRYLTSSTPYPALSFEKAIVLMNFRDNHMYIATPIYIRKNYIQYYLSPSHILTFDKDDLFYYAHHKIMQRGGHLFVADYGMQVTILSRYGIRSFAVKNRDYTFRNQIETDFRYSNIEIINPYFGVYRQGIFGNYTYEVLLHINGNHKIGLFHDVKTAAIAYNKAADFAKQYGISKNYPINYIDGLSPKEYADIYSSISLPEKFLKYLQSQNNSN